MKLYLQSWRKFLLSTFLFFLCLIGVVCLLGGKGKPIHSDTKELVCHIDDYFENEYANSKSGKPLLLVSQVLDRTSSATGLSKSTIGRILHEKRSTSELRSLSKKRQQKNQKTNMDNFDRDAIWRLVLNLCNEGYIPSVNDIHKSCQQTLNLELSRWAVWKIPYLLAYFWPLHNLCTPNFKFLFHIFF